MVLKRIGPLSCGKITGLLYALIGLVIGAVFSLVSMVVPIPPEAGTQAAIARLFGAGAVIWLPIGYGVAGFVGAIIAAALYNVMAGLVGGVHVELEGGGS